MVREQTLKSVLVIISKLSDRTINGELLRYLAKTANDEQPGIRTNTTICLGKIAKNLGASSRAKVLIAAFTRSLRDPFVHARNAALMALAVTAEYFGDDEVANRILPSICPLLLDKEKLVRDQAAKTMDVFLAKIRKAAAAMPDSALPATATGTGAAGSERPRMSTPQPSEVAGWAGWAISSFTNKLAAAAGEIQSASTPPPQAAVNGSDSSSTRAPAPKGLANTATKSPQTASSSASGLHRQAVRSPPVRSPSSSNTTAANVTSNPAPESWFPDDDADAGSGADAFDAAWGDMDDVEDNAAAGTDSGADTFFDALDAPAAKKTGPGTAKRETSTVSGSSSGLSGGAKPFGDEEPDFAGWLAAQQAQKKSGIGGAKALPKGPTKSATTTTGVAAKKPVAAAAVAAKAKTAPAAAKKIDMKVKDADDDDGWGDGW